MKLRVLRELRGKALYLKSYIVFFGWVGKAIMMVYSGYPLISLSLEYKGLSV